MPVKPPAPPGGPKFIPEAKRKDPPGNSPFPQQGGPKNKSKGTSGPLARAASTKLKSMKGV